MWDMQEVVYHQLQWIDIKYLIAGMISTRCSPLQIAKEAIEDARSICMRQYATAPDVTVYGDPRFTFAYVPSHLHHMIFELVLLFSSSVIESDYI